MNDQSEKEQLEEIRVWWSENGRYIIAGVVLGVSAIVGWNQWQSSIERTQISASKLYEEVMTAVGGGNAEAAEAAAHDLYLNYGNTVYPNQARLAMARLFMDKGRDQDAADTLRDVIDSGANDEIQKVARLRLARVLLYQDKPADVIELLEGHLEGGFASRYNEVLGDAYAAEGRYDEATQAYRAALADSRNLRTIDNNLILLKLNDLPEPSDAAAGSDEPSADPQDAADEVSPDAESAAQVETVEQSPAENGDQ